MAAQLNATDGEHVSAPGAVHAQPRLAVDEERAGPREDVRGDEVLLSEESSRSENAAARAVSS